MGEENETSYKGMNPKRTISGGWAVTNLVNFKINMNERDDLQFNPHNIVPITLTNCIHVRLN